MRLLSMVLSFCSGALLFGAESPSPAPTPEQEAALLKEVKVPDGFEAKVFAVPPAVNYPVFVAAAPDGTLYVSSDRNGSLDRAQNRGRVLRVRDTNGDGRADEVKEFVPNVDSPRGLCWDRDRLYLLHPPHLSVYFDRDGDGVAEEEKILVKNIAFTFKDRPADHSSNGIELGVDGWIYCAIGDFGFMEAEGTDGRKMQLRGGGVVRVRPDGSGLELYSHGTRNILEACVSPTLDIFARDNTNDGDGWDIRLHHFSGLSDHGYPSLFKNFKGEFIEPLADYGGGSGCGGLYLSEPGFPAGFGEALYTADWGREWVYRHNLTPDGATFSADQHEFVRAPRVTDLDVDALGHLYVSSWKGATFTYVGENVGFLLRVTPKGFTPEPLPDFAKSPEAGLIQQLESPSHRRRLAAQRELLARKLSAEGASKIEALARNQGALLPGRIASLYLCDSSVLSQLLSDSSIREYAIRALCDRPAGETASAIAAYLHDESPRVRQEAVFGLARLQAREAASGIASLLGDKDPTVAHTAMQALRKLNASGAAFSILDSPGSNGAEREGAARVLQSLHDPQVVGGLLTRLTQSTDAAHRRLLLTTLCRLYYEDGPWKGDSWGTRPDTTGPYYQPATWSETEKIRNVLTAELNKASGPEAAFLAQEFSRHKIQTDETLRTIIELAEQDPAVMAPALTQLARAETVPASGEKLLLRVAGSEDADAADRARAVSALAKLNSAEAVRAMLKTVAAIARPRNEAREVQSARQALLRYRNADGYVPFFEAEAGKQDSPEAVWATAMLLRISDQRNAAPEARDAARRAIDQAWNGSGQVRVLEAIALSEHRGSRERVLQTARFSSNPDAVAAAKRAARALRIEKELSRQEEKKSEPLLSTLPAEEVIKQAAALHGDRKLGEELFTRQTCNACHTVRTSDALRGPFLGNIATIYKRDELARAILLPNNTIAQGFATHHFELKDGTEIDGFVVQEAADKVTIRNVAAQELQFKTSEIARRDKLEKSLMPEGLVSNLTVKDLASLLDYLQSLAQTQ